MTEGQERTLQHIRQFINEHGRIPTIRQLMDMDGSRSTENIHRRLTALVEYGYLRRTAERTRRYVLNDDTVVASLRNCSTEELKAELARRAELGLRA